MSLIWYCSLMNSKTAYVLIDDDELVRRLWSQSAKMSLVNLHVFSNLNDFFKVSGELNRNVQIFLDSDLEGGVRGEDFVEEIYNLGFYNIYLATGYIGSISKPFRCLSVVAKRIPWAE